MTRGDIADYVGMTIETVSRTLTKLRAEGLIDIPNATDIIVLNRPAMERIARA
jgi:CRP/FNR family transcriptional regulator